MGRAEGRMSELKPCPFCGGEAHTYKNNLWHVACENAHNSCVTMSAFITEAEAIEAWNSRADDYRQAAEYWRRMYEEAFAERTCECVAEYAKSPIDGKTIVLHRCSACHELMRPHMAHCPSCGAKVVGE